MRWLALLLLAAPALAAPPPGVTPDPETAEYYHSLMVPGGELKGGLCCDVADCRNVDVRVGLDDQGSYYAWIDSKTFPDDGTYGHGHAPNAWVKVPEEVIIHDRPNFTGEAIACWYAGQLRCFVPSSGV